MVRTPLGNLSRSRKDWTLEGLRIGTAQDTATGTTLTAAYSLNNNAADGTYLALWGVLAFCSAPRGMMVMWNQAGLTTPANGLDAQIIPTAKAIAGFTNKNIGTTLNQPTAGIVFAADGRQFITNGDVPLFIIPPNNRVSVIAWEPVGNFNFGAITAVTFVWGEYSSARLNKLSARVK